MQIIESILTKNPCYTAGKKITVKGLMLHSVGCSQPNASVFIKNWNKESYNRACVHAFIDGNTGDVYQCLPWDHRGWHGGGSSNDTHIGVEMCEPDCIKYISGSQYEVLDEARTKEIVTRTYNSAVELFAKLCKELDLDPLTQICSHKEGHAKGIASNHGDPEHLWVVCGYTMDGFRAAVKAAMEGSSTPVETPKEETPATPAKKSNVEIAKEVYAGKWGNNPERRQKLEAAGYNYNEVQAIVNRLCNGEKIDEVESAPVVKEEPKVEEPKVEKPVETPKVEEPAPVAPAPTPAKKSNVEVAKEVYAGKWGNNPERRQKLEAAGYDYAAIQGLVNKLCNGEKIDEVESAPVVKEEPKVEKPAPVPTPAPTPVAPTPAAPTKKSNVEVAKEVYAGKWGNNPERRQKLEAAGYDYATIQGLVNRLCNGEKIDEEKASPAKKSVEEIAKEVYNGKWGNGAERRQKLEAAGYNYNEVQAIVNKLCK